MVKLFMKTELMVQFYKNRTHGSIVTIEPTSQNLWFNFIKTELMVQS